MSSTYATDFYAWAIEQAALLRQGRLSAADVEHIAAEIESMGRTEKRALARRLTVLLLHLLKWRFQPALRGNSWRNSVRIRRREIASLMEDNPSLRALLPAVIDKAYDIAVIEAETETGLAETALSRACPWSYEQMMDASFWPD
jgi:hypothetical protein